MNVDLFWLSATQGLRQRLCSASGNAETEGGAEPLTERSAGMARLVALDNII